MAYDLIEEVLRMASKQSTYQKNLERYMREYGEILLRGLTLEERLRGLTEEDYVDFLLKFRRRSSN